MRSNVSIGFVLWALVVGCSGASTGDPTSPSSAKDSGASSDSGNDEDTEGEDTGSTEDTGSGDDGGTTDSGPTVTDSGDTIGPPPDGTTGGALRFVALGDTGKGNDGQVKVAKAIAAKCAKDGCDFVQLLGDNIYDSGVSSTSDPQWTTKFETPYGDVSLPFYAVLGNHDYGGNGMGNEFSKGQHQVDYSSKSTKWKMPARHWRRSEKGVDMFGLDTNMIFWNNASGQKTDVTGWFGASKATWKIAFGHHPYYSNGTHGNAGSYEGFSWLPVANGKAVKDFFDSTVCGKVDVYICGHDHSRQWIKTTCKGTEMIVSGSGAATTELKGSNPHYWQESSLGFLYVVIEGNKFTGQFIGVDGTVNYTRTITK